MDKEKPVLVYRSADGRRGAKTPRFSRAVGAVRKGMWARWAGLSLSGIVALWFVGWLLGGDRLLLVRWGAYGAPWLAMLAILAAALLIAARLRAAAAATVVLAFVVATPVLPRLSPGRWFPPAEPGNLVAMTFNTSDMNGDFDAIAASILRERPDVVFFQQMSAVPALQQAIMHRAGRSPYKSCPDHYADTAIFSRLPLSNCRSYARGAIAAADAAVAGRRIHLWSLHAPHGQIAVADQQAFFLEAAQLMAADAGPVVVGGDLNSTEYNSVQAPLRDVLRDAYGDVGAGLGFTFPSHVRRLGTFGRLFRIDHILYRGDGGGTVTPLRARVGDNANSDHFPVVVSFRVR